MRSIRSLSLTRDPRYLDQASIDPLSRFSLGESKTMAMKDPYIEPCSEFIPISKPTSTNTEWEGLSFVEVLGLTGVTNERAFFIRG